MSILLEYIGVLVWIFIGTVAGSFLNALIYRLPRSISIAEPKGSFCPRCKRRLMPIDLIPVFSYLLRKGKCAYCGEAIACRYLHVEILSGILWGASGYMMILGLWDPIRAGINAIFLSHLILASYIDIEHYLIPDTLNAVLLICGAALQIHLIMTRSESAFWLGGIPSSLAGGFIGLGVLWLMAFFGRVLFQRDAMGHGDLKLARSFGAMLFPFGTLSSIFIAVILGALLGVFQFLKRKETLVENNEHFIQEEPETFGSLIKSGIAYLLLIDVWALLFPRLNRFWFGIELSETLLVKGTSEFDQRDVPALPGSILPFGPYLAFGATLVLFFEPLLKEWFYIYLNWVTH